MSEPFWKAKSLREMSHDEWESLCDNCGRCCLHKIEDEVSQEVHYTAVVCRYLGRNGRCTDYAHRTTLVPECEVLTPAQVESFKWLPTTCGYRRVAEGKDLDWWHPLISGNPDTVRQAGIRVTDRVISDEFVHEDDYADHVIRWVEQ